jgi:hypothetical protein
MSVPSPIRHRFNAANKRRVRLRIEAAAMMTGIVVLAHAALIGHAMAATEYAVDGLAVGTQLNFSSVSYREYKCNPSDQFEGLIWCQKARTDKGRRGSYIAAHSVLHSKDGNISYVNRSQEPAFLNASEAELNIQRYSRKLGEPARILKMPHRSGLPDGVIAVWGEITLEPLDQESIKILAEGKNPRKGFLIDYLRNFARSAKEGLPIYRIDGGPGFIWAASFDQKGRGTLRLAAVEVSGFVPPPDARPVVHVAAPTQQNQLPSPATVAVETEAPTQQEQLPPPATVAVETEAPTQQEQLPDPATVAAVQTEAPTQQDTATVAVHTQAPTQHEQSSSESNQTIESLQADLAISTAKIAELERAKSVAERALEEADQAKQAGEQARIAEKTTSDALIAELRAAKTVAGAKISRWEIALYGSVGGVLFFLATSAVGFLINRRKAGVSKKPAARTKPIEASAEYQDSRARRQPSTSSPGIAISEAAFERDLEEEVATINAAKAKLRSGQRVVTAASC